MLLVLTSALACACLVPAALASARLPRLLASSAKSSRYTWQIRPAQISYTGDGTGILGGFDGKGVADPGHLEWTSWTSKQATGSGAVWLDNCTPSCAGGTFTAHKVTVKAFRPVKGRFTRLTLRYRYHGKHTVDHRGIERIGGSWSYYIVGK